MSRYKCECDLKADLSYALIKFVSRYKNALDTFEVNLDCLKDAVAFKQLREFIIAPTEKKKSSAISDPAFFCLEVLISYSRPYSIRLSHHSN